APLDVASAWKPSAARTRAEPASHGLGITKAPGPSWRARNRMALSLWVAVMGGVPLREPKPPRRPGLPAAGPRPRWTSGRSGLADRLDLAVAVAGQPVLVAPQLLVELLDLLGRLGLAQGGVVEDLQLGTLRLVDLAGLGDGGPLRVGEGPLVGAGLLVLLPEALHRQLVGALGGVVGGHAPSVAEPAPGRSPQRPSRAQQPGHQSDRLSVPADHGFLPNALALATRPWRSTSSRGPKAEGRPIGRGLRGG